MSEKQRNGKVPKRRVELFYLTAVEVDVGVELEVVEELNVVEELVVVEALDGAVDVGAELDVVGELVVARLVAVDVLPAVDVLLKNDTFQLKFSIPHSQLLSFRATGLKSERLRLFTWQ